MSPPDIPTLSTISPKTGRRRPFPRLLGCAIFASRGGDLTIERGRPGQRITRLGVLASLLAFLVACGDTTEESPASRDSSTRLTKVTFRLNWNPNAEHAPYYLGKKKGYYQEEGIDIEILPGLGSAIAVQLVGTGDSMFGVAVADAVTVGRGQGIPVVSTAVLLQRSPTVLASFKEKGVTKLRDLYGKRIGVATQSTVYAYWVAFTKINQIDRSRLEEVNVGSSGFAIFVAGKVDVSGLLLTNEVVTIQRRGRELNLIHYWDHGVKTYGQVLVTSDRVIEQERDLARRFTRATVRSWKYSLGHVEEAIDALTEVVPETDKALEVAKWGPIKELARDPELPLEFGHQSLEGWTATYNAFKIGGLIDKDFDPGLLFVDVLSGPS